MSEHALRLQMAVQYFRMIGCWYTAQVFEQFLLKEMKL